MLQLAHVVRLMNVLRQAMMNINAHSHSQMPNTQCQCALKSKPYVVISKLSNSGRSMVIQAPSLLLQWVRVTHALTKFYLQREHQPSRLSTQLQSAQAISRLLSWSMRPLSLKRPKVSYQEPASQLIRLQNPVRQRGPKHLKTLGARAILTKVTKKSHQGEWPMVR